MLRASIIEDITFHQNYKNYLPVWYEEYVLPVAVSPTEDVTPDEDKIAAWESWVFSRFPRVYDKGNHLIVLIHGLSGISLLFDRGSWSYRQFK